jgi:hypothetical protein
MHHSKYLDNNYKSSLWKKMSKMKKEVIFKNAVSHGAMLQLHLWHDFYKVVFKIILKLYELRVHVHVDVSSSNTYW